MDDDSLQRFAAASRVSLRAVLIEDGQDPGPALAQAGIFDPVAVPVVLGEDAAVAGGIMGNGMTANLSGTLETEEPAVWSASGLDGTAWRDAEVPGESAWDGETLSTAGGRRPIAQVRQLGPLRAGGRGN